ncbi:MAG: DUF4428 domain-containing protein [Clostridia bacterium]|nr:DUF4428 domain-containing protein [Clostridia bacterium]
MGLFDKKYCDICGNKIGLLGNRKLEDGNCCKDCASLLSPWMTDRRQSTVEEIKQHLDYRQENQAAVAAMRPTRVLGNYTKIYIDEAQQKFFVTRFSNWQDRNPDVMDISQVTGCQIDVDDNKREVYDTDKDGKRVSFDPPRFEYSYEFRVKLDIDSPWFSEIEFELTDNRPDSPYTEAYRNFERQADEIRRVFDPEARRKADLEEKLKQALEHGLAAVIGAAQPTESSAPSPENGKWFCPSCGAANSGNFCTNCGTKRPMQTFHCDKCGWVPDDPAHPPKFCPQCGDPFNAGDLT